MVAEYDVIITNHGNMISCDKESLGWNISSPYERDQSSITCVLIESLGSQIA